MADRPVIGVTGPTGIVTPGWWATALNLWFTGAHPVRLTSATANPLDLERFAGIVVGGGSDIDPALYEGLDDGRPPSDPDRDRFEITVLDHVRHTRLPLLGICRGAQLLNVTLGGTLHQDIRPLRQKTRNRRTTLPRKTALSDGDNLLQKIIGRPQWKINSLHHQAVDKTGEGVVPVVHDLDGFIQGFVVEDHPWIGVQWHPEYLFYHASQRALFRWLVHEAQQ